jgi:hypothetical protein
MKRKSLLQSRRPFLIRATILAGKLGLEDQERAELKRFIEENQVDNVVRPNGCDPMVDQWMKEEIGGMA